MSGPRSAFSALCAVFLLLSCTPSEPSQSEPASPPGRAQRRCRDLDDLVTRVRRGVVANRGPSISFIPRASNYVGQATAPTHNGPWDYLGRVPFVLYAPGVIEGRGAVNDPASMADVAPSLAALIGFDGWPARDGRALDVGRVARAPRVMVVIVWDGGGLNTLAAHPDEWPFLARAMREGTSFDRFEIGSSPSVTPPVHATLGTGVWPGRHGIVSVKTRAASGEFVDPWEGEDPVNLEIGTLADLYDVARGNRPITGMTATVNWHLGMLGHGAAWPGGDHDPAALIDDTGSVYGNAEHYDLPDVADPTRLADLARDLDLEDGEADGAWEGEDLADTSVRYASPAYVGYQEHVLEGLVSAEGFGRDPTPDLLYVNFKQSDDAFHHWGLTSPRLGRVIAAQDEALRSLTRHLDESVGPGRWAVAVTADHGLMPAPADSGAWPIGGGELLRDVNEHFDRTRDRSPLVERVVSAGMYVDGDQLAANDVTTSEIADWLVRYTADENAQGDLPAYMEGRSDTPIFDAILVGRRVVALSCDPDKA